MEISTHLSIITLSVNGLNTSIKRHREAKWIFKKSPIYAAYKRLTSELKPHRPKMKGWKTIFHAKGNGKKSGVAILISDKIDFKTKIITKDKERHYIMIKGSV